MTEKKIVQISLALLSFALFFLALFSEGGGYGGGDSSMHMLIPKFSFKHPGLFLHHWGKPFFILASSPFAQFGFLGMEIFNIICALSSAYMIYLIAKDSGFQNSWMAFFFSLLSPVYFVVIFSGLTEIFFGFILVLSVFLVTRKKYFISAAIVSFLPFVRSEGYLLLMLFALLLIYRKKFTALPLLAAGTLIYSIAGGIYFHDFKWIIHQNPYGQSTIYGSGSPFYFLSQNEFIFGTALIVLIVVGILSFIIKREKKKLYFTKVTPEEAILLFGSIATYFIAHSVFWWKGWFGSAGLIRVMAGIAPLFAFPALRGVNAILSVWDSKILKAAILIAVVIMPFKQNKFPRQFDYEEATLDKACKWIAENNLSSKKIVYSHPFVVFRAGKDPFDSHSASEFFILNGQAPELSVENGDLIIWDSHFSPNEGKIPLTEFSENRNFRLLNSFSSDMSVTPKDKKFEVYVFEKI